ncbi:hypothetical protein HDA32_002206 [Spinactinospora alkalitolerans]|uniref:Uncharacterized protein n=1 Tax=Spinactinospora alkalitolerans TaxID=687207 RepID=A0A852TRR3_9ACTN|nr:hypothetical protein [Spinactinospora alkalitolerans]NYE47086.1 hypothetical protein [Spinactinospora alkalitolerans]
MATWKSPVELRIEARDRHRWLAAAALGGLVAGRRLNVDVRSWPAVAVVGGVLFVLLGVNQQFHADLLRTPSQASSPIGPILNAAPALALSAWIAVRRRRTTREADH